MLWKQPKTFLQKRKVQLIKKFHLGCKNHDDQVLSGRPKTMDSEAMLQARDKSDE